MNYIESLLAQEGPNKALSGVYYDDKGITAIVWKCIDGSSKIESLERIRSSLRDPITRKTKEIYVDRCNFDLVKQ